MQRLDGKGLVISGYRIVQAFKTVKDPCPVIECIEVIRFDPEGMITGVERLFQPV